MQWPTSNSVRRRKVNPGRRREHEVLADPIRWSWAIARGLRIGLLVLLVELLIFSGLQLMDFIYDNPSFVVRDIRIAGTVVLEPAYIKQKSGIRMGQNIFRIDPKQIRARILQDIRVADAVIRKELFNRVTIEIRERQPKYYLVLKNKLVYLDENGVIFPITGGQDYPPLPLLRAGADKKFKIANNRVPADYRNYLNLLDRITTDRARNLVSEIDFIGDDQVLIYTVSPVTRIIMSIGKLEHCLNRFTANLDFILDLAATTRYIDLRFDDITALPRK